MTLAMSGIWWILFLAFYLVITIPVLFFVSLTVAGFSIADPGARSSVRRSAKILFVLSLAQLAGFLLFFGGDAVVAQTAFERFCALAAWVIPFLFLLAAVLPQPHGEKQVTADTIFFRSGDLTVRTAASTPEARARVIQSHRPDRAVDSLGV